MTFQQLQYLLEVYNSSAVSRAAKNLYISPSSISNAIASLEEELGFPIFVRTKKGMTPTPRGKLIIERASQIYENYRLITQSNIPPIRQVRISLPHFSPAARAFVQLAEELKDDESVCLSNPVGGILPQTIEKLKLYEIDLAIQMILTPRMLVAESKINANGLKWESLGSFPVMIMLGPGHRLYDKEEISPRDLDNEILVDGPSGAIANNYFLNSILKFNPEKTVFATLSEVRHRLIAQGLCYSVGPLTEQAQTMYQLRAIPLRDISYDIVAITNPTHPLVPEAKRFFELFNIEFEKYKKYLKTIYTPK